MSINKIIDQLLVFISVSLSFCFQAIFFFATWIQSQSLFSNENPSLIATAFNFPSSRSQLGSELKCNPLTQANISCSSLGNPSHSWLSYIVNFFYIILSYFSFLACPFIDCQGNEPFKKQIKTYISDSRSSLLPCSIPKWVLMEAYLAVPVKSLLSLQAMCYFSLPRNLFAKPKSIIQMREIFCLRPIRKLSGLMSLWSTPREWTNLMSLSIYSPIMTVVFSEKCLSHRLSRSQREFPSKSITITQQFPSLPILKTLGMLIYSPIYLDFAKSIMNLLSSSS